MRDDDFFFDGPFFSFVLRRRDAMCFYPHRVVLESIRIRALTTTTNARTL